jgi:hypothetical protein
VAYDFDIEINYAIYAVFNAYFICFKCNHCQEKILEKRRIDEKERD